MAPFRIWRVLTLGIVFVTLLNTFILFSCKFSDSGCILSRKDQDQIYGPLPPQTNRQRKQHSRQVELPSAQAWEIVTSKRQAAGQQEESVQEKERMSKRPDAEHSQEIKRQKGENVSDVKKSDRQGMKDDSKKHEQITYEQWRKLPRNQEMVLWGQTEGEVFRFTSKDVRIAGQPRSQQAFLVIGVPTVRRKKVSYVSQTIRDLVSGLSEAEKQEVIIVVFITDFDPTSIKTVAEELITNFRDAMDSGLLQVIKADQSVYPSLSKAPLLWGDKRERVQWRSKQCLDYAFLFRYCKDLGQYYMQIEDDVTISNRYLKTIKNTIEKHKTRKWSILEFGARGFIGMLYRTDDLGRLSKFVKMYHWVWPVDLLYRQFNDFHLYGNPQWARYNPPLVRHVGAFSSLDGQFRKLEDMRSNFRTHLDNDNPPARISTSIQGSAQHSRLTSPYDTKHHGIYWASDIKKHDFILIEFDKAVSVRKLVVESGSPEAPEDYFGAANVEYSSPGADGSCKEYKLWKEFTDKPQLMVVSEEPGGTLCKCIRIDISNVRLDKKGKRRWLVVREIAVWSIGTDKRKVPKN